MCPFSECPPAPFSSCGKPYCWVHPVGHRFWWQGLLDYFVTYLIFLLIEKSKTRPTLPYPTLPYHTPPYLTIPCPPHQTLPTLPLILPILSYSTPPPLSSSSTTPPTPLYQYLSYPYWDWTLHSDSTTLSTTPSPTPNLIFINTLHLYPYHILPLLKFGRNDPGPKRPRFP